MCVGWPGSLCVIMTVEGCCNVCLQLDSFITTNTVDGLCFSLQLIKGRLIIGFVCNNLCVC